MANTDTVSVIEIPRMVLSVATGMMFSVGRAVVGDSRVRTARRNAWEAVCADRARARHRAETRQLVADLATASAVVAARGLSSRPQVVVGSSPRSNASHVALVGSAPRG
jgi:hypothetical protein